MANKAAPTEHIGISKRKLLNLAIILVLLYIIVPQIGKFRLSLGLIEHVRISWLVVGLALALATHLMAAASYWVLAKKPLHYIRTVVVQIAGMFANRLVPAGIGAISVNFKYLRRNHHNAGEASAVIVVNNTIGIIGHLTLLALTAIISHKAFQKLALPHIERAVYLIALAIAIILLLVALGLPKLRHLVRRNIVSIIRNIAGYSRQPRRLILAWLFLMSLTTLYVLTLIACGHAIVGLHLNFMQGLIVLTAGVAAGTVTPTPGGLVGAEAGLVAGLVACGTSSADALAVTLLYRLLTYWLPLLGGPLVLSFVERRGYI